MKRMLAASLLLGVVACAAPPEPVVGRDYLEKRVQAAAGAKQCMDGVKSASPVYARLNALFIYDLQDDRQLTKISNRGYVTEEHIADLIAFRDQVQPCYDRALDDYGAADPRYAEYLVAVREQSDANLLELMNRRITIGERNLYLLETLLGNRQKFAEIDRAVMSELGREPSLRTPRKFGEAGYVEEFGSAAPVRLPADSARPVPRDGARCRFEGRSIRCD